MFTLLVGLPIVGMLFLILLAILFPNFMRGLALALIALMVLVCMNLHYAVAVIMNNI